MISIDFTCVFLFGAFRLHLLLAFSRLDPLQRLAMLLYAQVTPDVDLLSTGLRLPWYDRRWLCIIVISQVRPVFRLGRGL